jgi:hypothetical protein
VYSCEYPRFWWQYFLYLVYTLRHCTRGHGSSNSLHHIKNAILAQCHIWIH